MSDRPTPETDAALAKGMTAAETHTMLQRRERQRDEAQEQPWPVVGLPRLWDQGSREEVVDGLGSRRWRITDLREAVKDCPVFDVPLAFLDLSAHTFNLEGGLIDFATHMRMTHECDLDYPIIFDQWGRILDGRHRLAKALVEGKATVRAVKIPDGTSATYNV